MSEHELWNELGNLYFLSKSNNQAVRAYGKAIQLDSNFGKPYSNLALVFAKQEKYEDAIFLYKRSLDLLTDDTEKAATWYRLGNVYRQMKDYQSAVYAYQQADSWKNNFVENQENGEQLQSVSSESDSSPTEMEKLQYDFHYQSVDYMLDKEPEFDENLPELVPNDIGLLDDDTQFSQDTLKEMTLHSVAGSTSVQPTEDATTQSSSESTLVETEVQTQDEDSLSEVFQTSEDLEIESDDLAATTLKTDTSSENVQEKESEMIEPIAQADEVVGLPSEEESATDTEVVIGSEEDRSEINTMFTEALGQVEASDPKEQIIESFSEDAQDAKREKEAEEILSKKIEIDPRSATTWEALGTLHKNAGRYEEAIDAFQQAISIDPQNVSYYHNLGLVYSALGNNDDAFKTFQKILELDPGHSLAHASLGRFYKKEGLDELAQRHIEKAMKQIYHSENEYNRACLDAICGNNDQAIELLRMALENKQTHVDWMLHDPDLESLRDDERFMQLISEFSK